MRSKQTRYILIQLLPLHECYTFRAVQTIFRHVNTKTILRKMQYRSQGPLFYVIIFIILKHKIYIIKV
jgi:hypothetical protein